MRILMRQSTHSAPDGAHGSKSGSFGAGRLRGRLGPAVPGTVMPGAGLLRASLLGASLLGAGLLGAGLLGAVMAPPAGAQTVGDAAQDLRMGTLSGAYLAGKHALEEKDNRAAAEFLSRALAHDPDNPSLLRSGIGASLRVGDFDRAVALSDQLFDGQNAGALARVVRVLESVRRGDLTDAQAAIETLTRTGVSRFSVPLIEAWVAAGLEDRDAAMAALEPIRTIGGFESVVHLHEAMLLDMLGATDEAVAAYQAVIDDSASIYAYRGLTSLYQRLGRLDEANALLDQALERYTGNLALERLRRQVDAGVQTRQLGRDTADGAAEALYSIASILRRERAEDLALIYVRLSLALRSDDAMALYLLGSVLTDQGRYGEAREVFNQVPLDSAAGWLARLGAANALDDMGRAEEALALLGTLADQYPERSDALVRKADLLRSMERFEEAVAVYDAAVAREPALAEDSWSFLYRRGIALERSQAWARAEQDLLAAIGLNPRHAHLLNYLGYSWIDRGENLEEGERLIRDALELEPDDGYIVDSLGWVYFRTGRIGEAVDQLERAVTLRPDDATINDHLGDAYWVVGRHREARFQWERALRLSDDDALSLAIEGKLVDGLSHQDMIEATVTRQTGSAGDEAADPRATDDGARSTE